MRASKEQWRPVAGTGGKYHVSTHGRLRSFSQKCPKGRILRKQTNSYGYTHYTMMRADGTMFTRTAHRLVLETFVGPKPSGHECRHLDGNRANNNVSNLRWGTHRENTDDRARHGRDQVGARHWKAKLTDAQVRAIRRRIDAGENISAVGRDYGITPQTAWHIGKRNTWRHVA